MELLPQLLRDATLLQLLMQFLTSWAMDASQKGRDNQIEESTHLDHISQTIHMSIFEDSVAMQLEMPHSSCYGVILSLIEACNQV